jgi:predicted DNA-binding antitoxin AbrB/MazE fold protein
MTYDIDAIFDQGVFRPLQSVFLPEGARVHLSVDQDTDPSQEKQIGQMRSPRLARPEQLIDFLMEVRNDSRS